MHWGIQNGSGDYVISICGGGVVLTYAYTTSFSLEFSSFRRLLLQTPAPLSPETLGVTRS